MLKRLLICSCVMACPHSVNSKEAPAYQIENPYPNFAIHLFGEAHYYSEDMNGKGDVVSGQQVGHLISSLSDHLTIFSEVTLTTKSSKTTTDVERFIVRYDFSDRFKLSVGKYHTPLGYWNSTYHHGAWLQTTIDRPRVMKFGSQIIPIHFEGILLEGAVPVDSLNFGYRAGVGNGLHNNISVQGGHHDVTQGDNAITLQTYIRSSALPGLEFGASYYQDTVNMEEQEDHSSPEHLPNIKESITGFHVALEREELEIVAEYIYWDHQLDKGGELSNTGSGYYIQVARRLDGQFEKLKPYLRFDKISADQDDILFAQDQSFESTTLGLRYDIADYTTLKMEYRNEQVSKNKRYNSVALQLSIVLPNSLNL
jgi:hypothetical protein